MFFGLTGKIGAKLAGFMNKFNRIIILLTVLFIVAIAAAFSRTNFNLIIISAGLLLTSVFLLNLWLFERKKTEAAEKDRQLKEKEKEIQRLKAQNREIASTAFNVQEIRQTLELAVFEASTGLYRIMDDTIEEKGKKVRYIGALRLDITAKYGVNLKEIICSVGDDNTIYLENLEPRFLAFSKRSAVWEIAECLDKSSGLKRLLKRLKLDSNQAELGRRKDEFRQKLEKEIEEKGPMELDFLKPVMKEKVMQTLGIIFGHYGLTLKSGISGKAGHVPLETFLEEPKKYLK